MSKKLIQISCIHLLRLWASCQKWPHWHFFFFKSHCEYNINLQPVMSAFYFGKKKVKSDISIIFDQIISIIIVGWSMKIFYLSVESCDHQGDPRVVCGRAQEHIRVHTHSGVNRNIKTGSNNMDSWCGLSCIMLYAFLWVFHMSLY